MCKALLGLSQTLCPVTNNCGKLIGWDQHGQEPYLSPPSVVADAVHSYLQVVVGTLEKRRHWCILIPWVGCRAAITRLPGGHFPLCMPDGIHGLVSPDY